MSLRFECTECGKCCRVRGENAHVYVDGDETRALARNLDMRVRDFKKAYTFVDEDGWRQLVFQRDRCTFLNEATNRCSVYAARPAQCRTFPFWPDLIRRGRWIDQAGQVCEGIGRGRTFADEEVVYLLDEMEEGSD